MKTMAFDFHNMVKKEVFYSAWIYILLIGVAFALTFYRSVEFKWDKNQSTWAVYAIPHSLSQLILDSNKKYTSNRSVRDTFTGELNSAPPAQDVNKAINKVLQLNKTQLGQDLYLWENEDKGIIDFVSMSFKIFGYKVESILYFYFFILFISTLIYSIAYFDAPMRLIILLQSLIMVYLIIPMTSFNEQLTTLMAPRAFPVLAIIASLHCIFFSFQAKYKMSQLILVAIQVAIIIFVTHLRIVTYWQPVSIAISCIVGASLFYFKNQPRRFNLWSIAPFILLIIGFLGLDIYRTIVFPNEYKEAQQPVTRVVWHNIFSGLAFDPDLAKRYQIKIDDRSIIDAAGKYLLEQGRKTEWLELNLLDGGGREHGYPLIHWIPYERVVREMFFARCQTYPFQCLRTAFYYKPLSLIKNLGWAYGFRALPADLDIYVSEFKVVGDWVKKQAIITTEKLDAGGLRAYLWTPVALILIGIAYIALFKKYIFDPHALGGLFIFALSSLIPSIIAYPGTHTILDSIVAFGVLIYTCLGVIVYRLLSAILKRRYQYQTPPGVVASGEFKKLKWN